MCSERPSPPPPPRNFPENGLKRLLRNPRNARELLALTGASEVHLPDPERMRVAPTTYTPPDFHHLEQDLVLEAPLRPTTAAAGLPDRLVVHVLIEHQSAPDVRMPFRLTDYIVLHRPDLPRAAKRALPPPSLPGPPGRLLHRPLRGAPVCRANGVTRWVEGGRGRRADCCAVGVTARGEEGGAPLPP